MAMAVRIFNDVENRFSEGRLAVGGQSCYATGASVLLTVYDGPGALVEVQLDAAQVEELCGLLRDRCSWLERGADFDDELRNGRKSAKVLTVDGMEG